MKSNMSGMKNVWLGKIETKDQALKIIKDISNGFYFIAALHIVAGYLVIGSSGVIDGVIYAVCAFLLRKFNSRAIAIILLLLGIIALGFTTLNKIDNNGGQNIFLAIIIIWSSIRAIQATFKLKKLQPSSKSVQA